MRRLFRLALLGLVLLLVALVSALAAMRLAIHGREVQVPSVAGMAPARAEQFLAGKGLRLETGDHFYSPTVAEGYIVSQSPAAGQRVRRGWRVEVAVSLGPPRTSVPSVVGESARAGALNVQRRGLELTIGVVNLRGLPADQVVAQWPPAESAALLSPKVGLLVTPAQPQQSFVMPDLTGRTLSQAAQAIMGAGLKVGNVPQSANTQPVSTAEPLYDAGTASTLEIPAELAGARVTGQAPAAGRKVQTGTVVTLQWQASAAPAPTAPPSTPAAPQ